MRLGRSNSSLLASESISTECARIAGYERLSESMRLSSEFNLHERRRSRKNRRAWGVLSKVFSFHKAINDHDKNNKQGGVVEEQEEEEKKNMKKKKKKQRSLWLPDPNRRWPVQGW